MKEKRLLLFNYRAGAAEHGYGEDDAAMVLAPHALKAYLEGSKLKGFDIRTLICDRCEPGESVLKKVYSLDPDIVGMGCYVWNLRETLDLARRLRLAKPDTEIILGGPEMGDENYAAEIMEANPGIDAVIRGEGEEPLGLYLDQSFPMKKISGLTYREKEKVVSNTGSPLFRDISELPSFYTPEFVRGMPVVYYQTSRGCVGQCRYCKEWSLKRNLPLDRVESDLKIIFANPDMKTMGFIDSVLDDDYDRLMSILEITASLNTRKIPISAYFYFRRAEPEMFDLLERAGFRYLRVGIESQDPETLKRVGRGENNLSHIDNVLPYRDRFTIVPYIISHLPGETPDSFRENIKSCFRKGLLQLDFHCNRLDIFPGTYISRHSREEGYTFDNRPPHHAFTSRDWPYEQFVNDKLFLRNVMVLGRIFTPEDEAPLAANGAGLFEIAETINDVFPSWKNAFRPLSSDTISDVVISEDLPELFTQYAKKLFPKKTRREAFLRLFMIRYYSFLARQLPEQFTGYRAFAGEIKTGSACFIPFFHRIKPGPDVLLLKNDPSVKFEDLPYSDTSIFIFGGFPFSHTHFLTTADEETAERFFTNLRKNQNAHRTIREMTEELEASRREQFISFVSYLKDRGALLECRVRDNGSDNNSGEAGGT